MASNEKLMVEFAGVLNEKLADADYAVAHEAMGCLLDDAVKAGSEITRLKNKVNRLAAANRELRDELSESRESHGVLGRLFGV